MVFVDIDSAFDCNCDGGVDGSLIDLSTCFKDDTTTVSCLEIKITQGGKFVSGFIRLSPIFLRLFPQNVHFILDYPSLFQNQAMLVQKPSSL